MKVKMILPALTEAKSPFWRPIKYSLFPRRFPPGQDVGEEPGSRLLARLSRFLPLGIDLQGRVD
jgi:hypothetical protein